jgi:primosomal protein N' (replication factor Y) (superfamily II helicase)
MYVQIAVNVPRVSGIFDYHLPLDLVNQVHPGCLVVVPFGKQLVQGVVLREIIEPQVQETRPVHTLLDPEPVLTLPQLDLAEKISAQTLSPLASCLHLMLPPGLSQQADTLYHLIEGSPSETQSLTALQQRILALFEKRGDLRGRQIASSLPHQNWKSSVEALKRKGLLASRTILLPPAVRAKKVRMVQLACSPEEAEAGTQELGSGKASVRRQAVLRFLIQKPYPVAVSQVYAGSGGNFQDIKFLAARGWVVLGESEVWRDPLDKVEPLLDAAPDLTKNQAAVWEQVLGGVRTAGNGEIVKPFLLQGVTGSGKTEIYLRTVAETLRLGRQVIILTPEISLTPQTVRRFLTRFPGKVGLVHSRLSPGERYDTWRRARAGELQVIVGPRSALFSPLPNLGLVVIDEFEDQSYYQSDFIPRYHAVKAAVTYSQLAHAVLILGSATPDVETLHRARYEEWNLLHLPHRVLAHRKAVRSRLWGLKIDMPELPGEGEVASLPLPEVSVVDMREELKAGNRLIFSRDLQQSISTVLAQRQQAILFLNRRGSATYVFCRACGYNLHCPRCDKPLTFHQQSDVMICHTCNYRRKLPQVCPECGSSYIKQYGTGTEKVEDEVRKLFPEARVIRWDAGTTREKGSHEALLAQFTDHQADILIGTQMLAKGLDLPLVTLVGVILADVGLNLPDYRSGERVFQLLTQVAGRAGRSPLGGRAIFQTFLPEHYAIQSAAAHDMDGFYEKEVGYRRKLGYPPYSRLLRLEYRHPKADEVSNTAILMGSKIKKWIDEGQHSVTEIIGPAPCFFSRQHGNYRWQIVLRGPDPAAVLRGKSLGDWQVEIDPPSLL